jgi:hypothetical protein
VIQPRQIPGLSFDDLAHRLFDIGRLAPVDLHQRGIGRFRFLMKTLENVCDQAAAE